MLRFPPKIPWCYTSFCQVFCFNWKSADWLKSHSKPVKKERKKKGNVDVRTLQRKPRLSDPVFFLLSWIFFQRAGGLDASFGYSSPRVRVGLMRICAVSQRKGGSPTTSQHLLSSSCQASQCRSIHLWDHITPSPCRLSRTWASWKTSCAW